MNTCSSTTWVAEEHWIHVCNLTSILMLRLSEKIISNYYPELEDIYTNLKQRGYYIMYNRIRLNENIRLSMFCEHGGKVTILLTFETCLQ